MGIFDDVLGNTDLGSIMDMVKSNPDMMNAAKSMLDPGDSSVGGSAGIGDILEKLKSAGLADQVASWTGSGGNLSISADQLQAALGSDMLQQFAEKAGLDLDQAIAALAQILPGLIDKLTPDGNAPSGGMLGDLLGSLG